MMRLLAARLTRPLRFRSKARTGRLLAAFARAERSSYFDMMCAANRSEDVDRRALYLRHALDESKHARMFRQRALELLPSLALEPRAFQADFESLFTRLGERQFVSFVHLGERRGRAQMLLFRDELLALRATPREDEKTLRLFEAVLVDEAQHEAYSLELVGELGGSLKRAAAWEAWRTWRRVGSQLAGTLFVVLTSVLYLALLPLALLERRRRY